MSWFTKKDAPRPEGGTTTAGHVAVAYADTCEGPRLLVESAAKVCARHRLTTRIVDTVDQLVAAAQDMTSAQVVIFPHFDALTVDLADVSDPRWEGVSLSPDTASAAGVTYVVGTSGQDGDTLQVLQTLFGPNVQAMSLLSWSAREIADLELMLDEALKP